LNGKTTRPGLRKCYACRKPFTVRIGSIFEDSHLPLHLWLQVIHLMCASKKGISTRQIQRMLRCSMKTAWHLTHRIRLAMTGSSEGGPLGGAGKVVEADETYFGNLPEDKLSKFNAKGKPRSPGPKFGPSHKRAILSLVERGGEVRSFYVEKAHKYDVARIVNENVAKESRLHTDESRLYWQVG
jgi:ISXO2-like transposase domain